MAKRKTVAEKEAEDGHYLTRDVTKTCVCCARSWADHTDEQWRTGCKEPRPGMLEDPIE